MPTSNPVFWCHTDSIKIDWEKFSAVAFIDSNVALECLALEQLPWREIHSSGPILVLVTPTVLQEVDSKKNHARLGDHARRFNRQMRPLLGEMPTVVVRPSPAPRVEVAVADCSRIDWARYPDLDPNEPDSKVVAQALTARGPLKENRVVVSQDIRPLHLARQHGLRIHHIGESWLRPKEIAESEKRAASLQREMDAMKSGQPKLGLSFKVDKDTVSVHRVSDLSAQERKAIHDRIIQLHPMREQKLNSNSFIIQLDSFDHTLSDRYTRWEQKIIPAFVREYERKVELNFGQVEILFRIENVGQVPAESLLIRLSAKGGWLNDRYVLASPVGPSPPHVRQRSDLLLSNFIGPTIRSALQPGKHSFDVQKEPKRSTEVQIMCADFRHGYNYEYRMIGWIDPHAEEFRVEAVVTAANLYGEEKEALAVVKTVIESSVYDLVHPDTLKFRQPPDNDGLLNAAISQSDFSDFEFDGVNWDK